MSKSLGNVISPMEVCDKFGADIMRIWVASSDYWDDPSFGWNLFNANSDTYRKLRNTLRYLLGALDGFTDGERVKREDMPGLEKWVLHRLAELDTLVRDAYHAYDFKAAFHALLNFCVVDLSAVYFDIRKDSLYCDAPSSVRRRAYRTVLSEIFDRLVTWYAPVMVFTCEEAWEQRYPGKGSVHLQQFPATPAGWLDPAVAAKWDHIFWVRKNVTRVLEDMRRDKAIGSSLEARVRVGVNDQEMLDAFKDEDAAEIFITSAADLGLQDLGPTGVFVDPSKVPSDWIKCARSWKYFDPKTADPEFPDITPRDAAAVREYRGLSK
jgi:isoleucyl-tRNA synthetase